MADGDGVNVSPSIRSVKYLKWLLYSINILLLISMAYMIPKFLQEASDIDQGKITLETEYRAEEQKGEKSIDILKIRSSSADKSRKMTLIGVGVTIGCSLLILISLCRSSFCCSFIPSFLLILPIVLAFIDMHWTQQAIFKYIYIFMNGLNATIAYLYSFVLKSNEYTRMATKTTG